jgi:hypothetical protein
MLRTHENAGAEIKVFEQANLSLEASEVEHHPAKATQAKGS